MHGFAAAQRYPCRYVEPPGSPSNAAGNPHPSPLALGGTRTSGSRLRVQPAQRWVFRLAVRVFLQALPTDGVHAQ
jgi:hypothetical protein